MKYIKKLTACVMVTVICCLLFAGCGEEIKVNTYKPLSDTASFEGQFAENGKYSIEWDSDYSCVLIKDKTTGETVWSSIPTELYNNGFNKEHQLCSPISVSYLEPDTNLVKTAEGSTEITAVSVEKTENSIKVFYDFSAFEICVPVCYELTDDGLSVSVSSDEITEKTYRVYQVSLLPYMVSAKNSEDKNTSWLFVPYGSGALMYTDDTSRALRKFEGEVYGDDLSINRDEVFNTDESLKLPIFGARSGDTAILAIIDSGAEYASVTAQAGNSELGYSNAYASFKVRGYNTVMVDNVGAAGKSDAIVRVSDDTVSDTYKISYRLLSGEDADILKMAEIYREHLNSVYGERDTAEQPVYQLDILGGAFVEEYILGIPNSKLQVATSYSEAYGLIDEVAKETGVTGSVVLTGFGESGLDYGKLAGGFGFNGGYGSGKELKRLIEEKNAFADFELVRFSSGSNGFSTLWDSAKNANNSTANQYYYGITDKVKNENIKYYKLLKRSSLSEALGRLIEFSEDESLKNISVGSLGYIAYSDYSEKKYAAKGSLDSDIAAYIKRLSDSGKTVMVSNANDYAAARADIVTEAPLTCGAASVLDEEIPFYSMVFKGYTALVSSPLNLSDDMRTEYLNAVSCGVGIQFSFCAEYADALKDTSFGYMFAQSVYSDIKDDALALINESAELLEKVKTAHITGWKRMDNGVTVTEFDNGIKVFANYSEAEVETECGAVPAMSFGYIEGR